MNGWMSSSAATADDATIGESYADILARHGLDELTADGEVTPHPERASMAPSPAFAAQFAEVHIDADLGLLRVARMVTHLLTADASSTRSWREVRSWVQW